MVRVGGGGGGEGWQGLAGWVGESALLQWLCVEQQATSQCEDDGGVRHVFLLIKSYEPGTHGLIVPPTTGYPERNLVMIRKEWVCINITTTMSYWHQQPPHGDVTWLTLLGSCLPLICMLSLPPTHPRAPPTTSPTGPGSTV